MVFNTSLSERNPVLRVRDVWERTNATVADFKLVVPSTSMPLIPFSTHGSATVRNSRHLDARHKQYKWKSTSFPGSCFYPGNEVEWKAVRAVFKWLSKVITWLPLPLLVIGSRKFFNQWVNPQPLAPCTRDFSRALSELQIIARNCDWFIVLFVPVVIGRKNWFGFGFSTVIWKPI